MAQYEKLLLRILSGTNDKNIMFADLRGGHVDSVIVAWNMLNQMDKQLAVYNFSGGKISAAVGAPCTAYTVCRWRTRTKTTSAACA